MSKYMSGPVKIFGSQRSCEGAKATVAPCCTMQYHAFLNVTGLKTCLHTRPNTQSTHMSDHMDVMTSFSGD